VPAAPAPAATPAPAPAAASNTLTHNGQQVTILNVKRPSTATKERDNPGFDLLEMMVRLDNPTDRTMRTNPLQFQIQGSDLVMYDSRVVVVADDLKCCDLAPQSSVVGRVFFELPPGVVHQTLFWKTDGPPQKLDLQA
jgi:hypothetical protein